MPVIAVARRSEVSVAQVAQGLRNLRNLPVALAWAAAVG